MKANFQSSLVLPVHNHLLSQYTTFFCGKFKCLNVARKIKHSMFKPNKIMAVVQINKNRQKLS